MENSSKAYTGMGVSLLVGLFIGWMGATNHYKNKLEISSEEYKKLHSENVRIDNDLTTKLVASNKAKKEAEKALGNLLQKEPTVVEEKIIEKKVYVQRTNCTYVPIDKDLIDAYNHSVNVHNGNIK